VRGGRGTARRLHPTALWQVLREQHTFVTAGTAVQTSAVPGDWDRFISNSFFNRTTQRTVLGPITPQQWQSIQAQPQLNRVFLAFIQRHGQFLITPVPTPNETIAYEYVTKNWAKSSGGVPQDRFIIDSPAPITPARAQIYHGIEFNKIIAGQFLRMPGAEAPSAPAPQRSASNHRVLNQTLDRAVAKGYIAPRDKPLVEQRIVAMGKRHGFSPDRGGRSVAIISLDFENVNGPGAAGAPAPATPRPGRARPPPSGRSCWCRRRHHISTMPIC
jgi:hypothetical protein